MVYEIEDILDAVCTYTHFTIKDLKKKDRHAKVNRARQYFMYLAYEYTSSSYTEVAGMVNRDHATALYARRKYMEGYVPAQELRDLEEILIILDKGRDYPYNEMNTELGKAYYYSTKSFDFNLGIDKLKK